MQKISIKNFFAIQEAEFELDKMLLLIGEQASGKSTVAKLVHFFKSLPRENLNYISLDDPSPEETSNNELLLAILTTVRKRFYAFFGSTKHLDDFEIEYSYSSNKHIRLSLTADKRLDVKYSNALYSPLFKQGLPDLIQAARQGYSQRQGGFNTEVAYLGILKNIETFINALFEDKRRPFFIPAGRNVTVGFGELFESRFAQRLGRELEAIETRKEPSPSVDLYIISEFLDRVAYMKERFRNRGFEGLIDNQTFLAQNSESTPVNGTQSSQHSVSNQAQLPHPLDTALQKITEILKGRYAVDRYGEKIFFADDKYVDLNDASSGQQESIRILQDLFLVLLDREAAFRVIEEPESHLFPTAQKHIIQLISFMLNYTDSQVFITTHSPYILSVLNNLLYATQVNRINSSAHAEIVKTIPQLYWLKPETFYAYAIKNGRCESIVDQETGLIDQNYLDEISLELGSEFNTLYQIRAEVFR